MAYMTVEQKDALIPLLEMYGEPRFRRIEFTNNAYGVVWIQWPVPSDIADQRNLFIRPDGSRLSWSNL